MPHFYCRKWGEYHLKTYPHCSATFQRKQSVKVRLSLALLVVLLSVSSAQAVYIRLGEGVWNFFGQLAPLSIPIIGVGIDKSVMRFGGQENVLRAKNGTHPAITDLTIECGGGGIPLDNFMFERVRFRRCILTYNNGFITLKSVVVEHCELRPNNPIANPNGHALWMSFLCGKDHPEEMPDFFSCPDVTITLN